MLHLNEVIVLLTHEDHLILLYNPNVHDYELIILLLRNEFYNLNLQFLYYE
jgi:hypothetical protein